jgi:hypothetical protein
LPYAALPLLAGGARNLLAVRLDDAVATPAPLTVRTDA